MGHFLFVLGQLFWFAEFRLGAHTDKFRNDDERPLTLKSSSIGNHLVLWLFAKPSERTVRLFLAFVAVILAGLLFAPTGVPLRVFSDADLAKVPSHLLSAARLEQLDNYAVRLAVSEYVEPRGPKIPQPEHLLTYFRGRLLSGKDKMAAFALENGYVGREIYGWEDAASQCFDKPAEELSLSDAATLVLHMRSPSSTWGNRAGDLLERRNAFLLDMAASNFITDEAVAAAATLPLDHCGS